MRIIHVVGGGPVKESIRGDQRHVLYLATAQQARGLSVAVMTDGEGLFTEACERQGIPVLHARRFYLPGQVNSSEESARQVMDTRFVKFRAEIIGQFSKFCADLIHCHDEVSAYTAIAAGNETGIPCVFTPHTPISELFPHLRADRKFMIISISRSVFKGLQAGGLTETGLCYVPNGTSAGPYLGPAEVPGKKPGLMIVGRVSEDKGIHTALLAMTELKRMRGARCPELNIYGGGSRVAYFKEMAAVLGLAGIINFHGLRFDILQRCPRSDILVLSSRRETGPLVVLEAMSRGMPIVATRVGDVAEFLPDQRYGRVIPADSIVLLAAAIDATLSAVAAGTFSPELLLERHRTLYTADLMAERIESVYNQLQGT